MEQIKQCAGTKRAETVIPFLCRCRQAFYGLPQAQGSVGLPLSDDYTAVACADSSRWLP